MVPGELYRLSYHATVIVRESSQKRVKDHISSLHGKIEETREEFEISHKQHQQVLTDLARVSAELEELREENLKLEHGRGLRAGALEWIIKVTDLLRTQQNVLTELQQRANDVSLAKENDQLNLALSGLGDEQEKISRSAKTADQEFEKVRVGIAELASQLAKNTDVLIESRV